MKYLLLLLLSLSITTASLGQLVFEQVLNEQEAFDPFFSKEKATIDFSLYKIYSIGKSDTNYRFVISLQNTKLEEQGVSSGIGVAFGSGGSSAIGASGSTQYSIKKLENKCSMNLDTLKLFLEYANNIYVYAKENDFYPTVAIQKLKNLRLAVEVTGKGKYDSRFLFSIGEAIFSLPEGRFVDMIQSASRARDIWMRAPE